MSMFIYYAEHSYPATHNNTSQSCVDQGFSTVKGRDGFWGHQCKEIRAIMALQDGLDKSVQQNTRIHSTVEFKKGPGRGDHGCSQHGTKREAPEQETFKTVLPISQGGNNHQLWLHLGLSRAGALRG